MKNAERLMHPPGRMDGPMVQFDKHMLLLLFHWITERDNIREARQNDVQAPWTTDHVLRDTRFCNVCRRDDRVSLWLWNNWYLFNDRASARTLLIAAALARNINWPDTLAEVGFPSKWSASGVKNKLAKRAERGDKIFTGAYIINGARGGPKYEQVVRTVHAVATDGEALIDPHSMQETHRRLMGVAGIGSFIAGQIVADLRWTHVLREATDALTWAPRGPGSTRGLNRLLKNPSINAPFKEDYFITALNALHRVVRGNGRTRAVFEDRGCELMDLQNCLCEFDKYVRIRNGEGRGKNKFNGRG